MTAPAATARRPREVLAGRKRTDERSRVRRYCPDNGLDTNAEVTIGGSRAVTGGCAAVVGTVCIVATAAQTIGRVMRKHVMRPVPSALRVRDCANSAGVQVILIIRRGESGLSRR